MASTLYISVGMNTVIIVSVCSRVIKLKENQLFYEFHFKGVFAGHSLKKVILTGAPEIEITKDKEYLIKVRLKSVNQGILLGEILKIKPLEEYWDRS